MGGIVVLAIVLILTLFDWFGNAPLDSTQIIGLGTFWLIGILITIVPFGFRLEIGGDYIKTYFLGFTIRDLQASNVQVMEYGNLLRGGLGAGKGLKIWEKTKKGKRYFSIGENAYGKEGIAHAKRALESEGSKQIA